MHDHKLEADCIGPAYEFGAAILVGTLAAALGLGLRLWIPGLLFWAIGHGAAVLAAKADPDFLSVASRSTRHKEHLSC